LTYTGVGCKINKINLQSRIKIQKKQSLSVKTRPNHEIYKKKSPSAYKKADGECMYSI
jgi:hypothetical protein